MTRVIGTVEGQGREGRKEGSVVGEGRGEKGGLTLYVKKKKVREPNATLPTMTTTQHAADCVCVK